MTARRDDPAFDYIIVGAGTAGGVLAARLAADGRSTIAVIEAGGRATNPLLSIPMGVGQIWNDPRYNWSYRSEPETGLYGRSLFLPRGKILGGSSAINAMNYVRGNRQDFDDWASLGLPGWSYDQVLPSFVRSETWQGGTTSPLRGGSGPIGVNEAGQHDPLIDAVFASLEAAGHRRNPDYNGATQDGFGRAQFNLAGGRRQDTASRLLHPAAQRGQIEIISNTLVDRIVLSDQRRAVAVDCLRDGQAMRLHARREIILSAGVYGSPAILMRSGIGPAAELAALGITPMADLAEVGRNLFDHPRIALEYRRRQPSEIHATLRYDRLLLALARAALFGTGPASQPLAAGHLFARTRPDLTAPNIQALFRLFNPRLRPRLPFFRADEPDTFGFVVCLLRPISRGDVRLAARDAEARPRIRHNFLAEQEDLDQLVEGGRMLRHLASHPLLDEYSEGEIIPGPDCQNDDEWADFTRRTADTIFHPAGSCAMGRVVDADLRVQTVAGLRVVDASVMPLPVSGNTNAAVMMIAERASDLIAKDGRRY